MAGCEGAALDFGCGPGVFAAALASAGFDVVGIDFSSDMLELASANPDVQQHVEDGRLRLIQGDWYSASADLNDASFRVISALGFVYYLEDLDRFFSRASSLLEPSGLLVVSFRNRAFDRSANHLAAQMRFLSMNLSEDAWVRWAEVLDGGLRSAVEREFSRDSVPQVDLPSHYADDCRTLGEQHGLSVVSVVGIHAHLLHPVLDRDSLTPLVDLLSAPLESSPDGDLSWFSHFLMTYSKD